LADIPDCIVILPKSAFDILRYDGSISRVIPILAESTDFTASDIRGAKHDIFLQL
jgi:hypothetical protein